MFMLTYLVRKMHANRVVKGIGVRGPEGPTGPQGPPGVAGVAGPGGRKTSKSLLHLRRNFHWHRPFRAFT